MNVCRSKIQVVGDAFDEPDGVTPVLVGGEHLGGERELGVDDHAIVGEIHDERDPLARMVNSGLAACQDNSAGTGI